MIKPVHEGSSVGISLVSKENEIMPAIEKAEKFDNEILIVKLKNNEHVLSGNYCSERG